MGHGVGDTCSATQPDATDRMALPRCQRQVSPLCNILRYDSRENPERPVPLKILALVALCAVGSVAQSISATTSPDPVMMAGGAITLTLRAPASQTISLSSSVGYTAIRLGSPTGPDVMGPVIGLPMIVYVGACQSYTCPPWVPPAPAPGTVVNYWFEVGWFDAAYALHTDHFPFSVGNSVAVILEPAAAATGSIWQLGILDPPRAGAPYLGALSFTTNTGFPMAGVGHVALDLDALFGLCFPAPLAGWATNLQGTLDGTGQSPAILIPIPALPWLICSPVHFQAAVLNPVSGQPMLTPCLDTSIQ